MHRGRASAAGRPGGRVHGPQPAAADLLGDVGPVAVPPVAETAGSREQEVDQRASIAAAWPVASQMRVETELSRSTGSIASAYPATQRSMLF